MNLLLPREPPVYLILRIWLISRIYYSRFKIIFKIQISLFCIRIWTAGAATNISLTIWLRIYTEGLNSDGLDRLSPKLLIEPNKERFWWIPPWRTSGSLCGIPTWRTSGSVWWILLGVVQDTSVGFLLGVVQDTSVGFLLGVVQDTSIGSLLGVVQDTSLGSLLGVIQDPSVGSLLDVFQDPFYGFFLVYRVSPIKSDY